MGKKLWFGMSLDKWTQWDIGLFKLSVACFALFLVSVWPAFGAWVLNTHWLWFLGLAILAMIKPMMLLWK